MRAGRRHRSIVLQADAKHLMTDVWTSAGVIVAVLLVGWTGWLRLDPLIAMAVALNIVLTGPAADRQLRDGPARRRAARRRRTR